jgi:streptomycin 6-kinase
MFDVPEAVRKKAIVAGGQRWLDDLPQLIEEMTARWSCNVTKVFDGGSEAFTALVERADSTQAVMKLLVPRSNDFALNEIRVLHHANGQGCAELFAHDEDRGALLMEALGPSLFDLGMTRDARDVIFCNVAKKMWRPAQGLGLETGAAKAARLSADIARQWEETNRPCSEAAIAYALVCAQRRQIAHRDERSVLVHGDIHEWNVLQAGVDSYKLIDPDGLLAEPEYDLGVIIREDPEAMFESEPFDRANWFARETGGDANAIWEWGVVERVSTGLVLTTIDMQPIGRDMLAAADRVAELYG